MARFDGSNIFNVLSREYAHARGMRYVKRLFGDFKQESFAHAPEDKAIIESMKITMLNELEKTSWASHDECGLVGYTVLGPILLGYVTWLHERALEDSAHEIWFLSREGSILMRAYEELYQESALPHRYINVSRVSLCRAAAAEANSYGELLSTVSCLLSSAHSAKDLLDILGIDYKEEDLLHAGIDPVETFESVNGDVLLSAIQSLGKYDLENYSALARKYLAGNGGGNRTIILSDIGWAGTMQALLSKLIPDATFTGAYLAVSDYHDSEKGVYDRSAMVRHGYWCDSSEWATKGQVIRFTQTAAEILFLNSEGTTLGYAEKNGEVVPVKAHIDKDTVSSRSADALDDAALRFMHDFTHSNDFDKSHCMDANTCFLPYLNAIVDPMRSTIRFYQRFNFVDGVKEGAITAQHHFLFYLTHPRAAKEEFEGNNSKIIWMRDVLKLPLPYYRLLRFLTSKGGLTSSYSKEVQDIAAGNHS